MSLITPVAAECPSCGQPCEMELFASINADRRPDLRAAILDETLQGVTCENCDTAYRVPPRLTYVDFERGQWIAVHPGPDMPRWAELEPDTQRLFDENYGATAPPLARDLGLTLQPRMVFGWTALREKLLCSEHDLADVRLELLKLAVLRNVQKSPIADQSELRLDRVRERELTLSWFALDSGVRMTSLKVPREVYDGIDAETGPWAPLGARLSGHLFVDINRLLVVP